MTTRNDSKPLAKKQKCAVCDRPSEPEFRPFCSKRCADIDLGRWFGERYMVSRPIDPEELPEILDKLPPDEG